MKMRCNICGYIHEEININLECPLCHTKNWHEYNDAPLKDFKPVAIDNTFVDVIKELGKRELDNNFSVYFLGKQYSFPKELKTYIACCNAFECMTENLNGMLYRIMQNPNINNGTNSQEWCIDSDLRNQFREEAKQLLLLFAKHDIYNITERDLVENNKGYLLFQDAYKKMFNSFRLNLADEMEAFLTNMDDVQRGAYSQVTGTGISMYSSSLIAHLTLAAFETSTVKKQCMKADRDYELAMDQLISNGRTTREKADAKVMAETYPRIVESFSTFVNELLNIYLQELQKRGMFDFSKILQYNLQRSSDLLGNLDLVEDKRKVLELAFEQCPYNPDIYAKVLELNIGDVDTYMTAKEFYQESTLYSIIEEECNKSLDDKEKTMMLVTVMANYNGQSVKEILYSLYSKELNPILTEYKKLILALEDNEQLDEWIRLNLITFTEELLLLSSEEIDSKIAQTIFNIFTKEQFDKFSKIGLLNIKDIRLKNSTAFDLETINIEFCKEISKSIFEYKEEAIKRKKKLDEAYIIYNQEIENRTFAIKEKKNEMNSLGLFSMQKKQALKKEILNMENELQNYKNNNVDINNLVHSFENMYKK